MKVVMLNINTGKLSHMDLAITNQQIIMYRRFQDKVNEIFPDLTPVERKFLQTGMSREEQNKAYEKECEN